MEKSTSRELFFAAGAFFCVFSLREKEGEEGGRLIVPNEARQIFFFSFLNVSALGGFHRLVGWGPHSSKKKQLFRVMIRSKNKRGGDRQEEDANLSRQLLEISVPMCNIMGPIEFSYLHLGGFSTSPCFPTPAASGLLWRRPP